MEGTPNSGRRMLAKDWTILGERTVCDETFLLRNDKGTNEIPLRMGDVISVINTSGTEGPQGINTNSLCLVMVNAKLFGLVKALDLCAISVS